MLIVYNRLRFPLTIPEFILDFEAQIDCVEIIMTHIPTNPIDKSVYKALYYSVKPTIIEHTAFILAWMTNGNVKNISLCT